VIPFGDDAGENELSDNEFVGFGVTGAATIGKGVGSSVCGSVGLSVGE